MRDFFTRTISGIILGLVLFFIFNGCSGPSRSSEDSLERGMEPDGSAETSVPDSRNPLSGFNLDTESVRAYIFTPSEALSISPDMLETEIDRLDVPFVPWVNQFRSGDFIYCYDTLFFPVNGLGFGRIYRQSGDPIIIYPEENEYFSGRTLGKTCLDGERIICQFYGDRVFSQEPVTGGPPLAAYSSRNGEFEEMAFPSREAESEELVEIFFREDEWLLSWKSSGEEGISFRRQIYYPSPDETEPIEAEEYRQKLFPLPINDAPEAVSVLFARYLAEEPYGDRIYLINWVDQYKGGATTWYHGDTDSLISGDAGLYILNGLTSGNESYLLDGEDRLLWSSLSDNPAVLPELPRECMYAGFSIFDSLLVLSWEEQRFPSVGAAGIIIAELTS